MEDDKGVLAVRQRSEPNSTWAFADLETATGRPAILSWGMTWAWR